MGPVPAWNVWEPSTAREASYYFEAAAGGDGTMIGAAVGAEATADRGAPMPCKAAGGTDPAQP